MGGIARKDLFTDKTRMLISVVGVALSVTLMMVLWSLYQGWNHEITAYVSSVDADLWVAPQGVGTLAAGVPVLPDALAAQIEGVPGVTSATPLLVRENLLGVGDGTKKAAALIVGYPTGQSLDGPVEIVRGASEPGRGEIIVDRGFARAHGVSIGDAVYVNGVPFIVSGISSGGNIFAYQIVFLGLQDAQQALQSGAQASFFTVKLTPGADVSSVTAAIQAVGNVSVISRDGFVHENRSFMDEGFLPLVSVLLFISFAVGVAVIGLTIYTSVIHHAREYGVLKAIGASNLQLYNMAFQQALISGVAGYVLALGLTYAARIAGAAAVSTFVTAVSAVDYGFVLAAALVMSLLASYIPVRQLVAIDPVEVFKQ